MKITLATRRGAYRYLALSVFLGIFAQSALAQDISGSIVGSVLDTSGAGVPEAKVTVTDTNRNVVVRTAKTDHEGNYAAPLLAVGTYSVTVEAAGFKRAIRKDIILNANDKLTAVLNLEVGDVLQEVTVEAGAVQVELQSPTLGNTIDSKQITE